MSLPDVENSFVFFFFAFSMETTFFFLPSRHRNFELYQVMSLVLVFTEFYRVEIGSMDIENGSAQLVELVS